MAIGKDVLQLILVTEKIDGASLEGMTFSVQEAALIRECAMELLEAIPEPMPDKTLVLPFVI